ncbi:Myosin-1, partial [Cucumispora dikerogammari]
MSSKSTQERKTNTKVWILKDNQYIKGEIITVGKTYLYLDTDKGKITVCKSETYPVNSEDFDMSANLEHLAHLNEPSVINILKKRFFEKKMFTNFGSSLVILNPYKKLDIYNRTIMDYYARLTGGSDSTGFDEEIPPHIFRVTSAAYSQLLNNREDHSILITGESGA